MGLNKAGGGHGVAFCGLSLLATLLTVPSVQAVTLSDSVTITLEATFTEPPCEIDVPPVVHLGSIHYGEKRYRPFALKVNCATASKAEIYAQTTGTLVTGTTDTMVMSGSDTRTNFWLEENGTRIKLNGETNTTDSGFCPGTESRTCTLTPGTLVSSGAREGERSAVIKFSVRYKA
ncbi:fimbrial protein [Citrobacter braakii]